MSPAIPALVFALVAPVAPVAGRGASELPLPLQLPGDTIEVASNPLEAAALSFADGLGAGSADRLGALLSGEGIRLQLENTSHSGLSARQATAALRDFLRGFDPGRAVVLRAAPVQGSPTRGFAELVWSVRAAGTAQELRKSLFVGLTSDGGRWYVDEIRVLP